jgi:hypothetical protein
MCGASMSWHCVYDLTRHICLTHARETWYVAGIGDVARDELAQLGYTEDSEGECLPLGTMGKQFSIKQCAHRICV